MTDEQRQERQSAKNADMEVCGDDFTCIHMALLNCIVGSAERLAGSESRKDPEEPRD